MILPDVNVLVYALNEGAPRHAQAKAWLEMVLVGDEPLALWDVTLVAVYRILTNPRTGSVLVEPGEALAAIQRLREAPATMEIRSGARFWANFAGIVLDADVRGPIASDAMLAALAIEHRCRLATFDRDFARFKGLQTFEPFS